MAEASADGSTRLKGRKRLRYEEEWKRKKRKLQKDAGKVYETYKGESRAEKIPAPIACCQLKCATAVSGIEQNACLTSSTSWESMIHRTSTCTDLLGRRALSVQGAKEYVQKVLPTHIMLELAMVLKLEYARRHFVMFTALGGREWKGCAASCVLEN